MLLPTPGVPSSKVFPGRTVPPENLTFAGQGKIRPDREASDIQRLLHQPDRSASIDSHQNSVAAKLVEKVDKLFWIGRERPVADQGPVEIHAQQTYSVHEIRHPATADEALQRRRKCRL